MSITPTVSTEFHVRSRPQRSTIRSRPQALEHLCSDHLAPGEDFAWCSGPYIADSVEEATLRVRSYHHERYTWFAALGFCGGRMSRGKCHRRIAGGLQYSLGAVPNGGWPGPIAHCRG